VNNKFKEKTDTPIYYKKYGKYLNMIIGNLKKRKIKTIRKRGMKKMK